MLFCACNWFERKAAINKKSTVAYQATGITKKEALRLGNLLLDRGYFNTLDEQVVYLHKKGNVYNVTFIINKELFLSDKENILAGFAVWQQWIQEYAFGYAPTVLILADEEKRSLYKLDSTLTQP
jgi:hypothetical protein